MKRILKVIFIGIIALLLIGGGGFYFWSQSTYEPSKELEAFIQKEEIKQKNNWIIYKPDQQVKKGIILYPGAKVEPEAYSYYAKGIADKGYMVIIPKMNLNFAIFDVNQADQIIEEFQDIKEWYIGGHSLGGVAAASFAHDHEYIKGLLLLASYPSSSDDFSSTDLPILSLYAENDQLTTPAEVKKTKGLLSRKSTLYEIKGGNHAQFGMYGEQKGDGVAKITPIDQQTIMIKETLRWLEEN